MGGIKELATNHDHMDAKYLVSMKIDCLRARDVKCN